MVFQFLSTSQYKEIVCPLDRAHPKYTVQHLKSLKPRNKHSDSKKSFKTSHRKYTNTWYIFNISWYNNAKWSSWSCGLLIKAFNFQPLRFRSEPFSIYSSLGNWIVVLLTLTFRVYFIPKYLVKELNYLFIRESSRMIHLLLYKHVTLVQSGSQIDMRHTK